jgi:hypothetical protein
MGRRVVSHSFFAENVALRRGAGGLARTRGLGGQSGFPRVDGEAAAPAPRRFRAGVGDLVRAARLELPPLDPVAREFGLVVSHAVDEAFGVLAADEDVNELTERWLVGGLL